MFDQRPDEFEPVDFDEIANHLLEQGLELSPSELHGCLCGLLAAGGPAEPEWGLAAACEALDLNLFGPLAEETLRLYSISALAFEDEEFDFHPLLPDDDAAIAQRTASLGAWCRGFLAGFARGGSSPDALAGDSAEAMRDFGEIACAGVDEEAEEEESEESYAELVEYLRFAALNVYLDSRSALDSRGAAEGRGGAGPGQDPAAH